MNRFLLSSCSVLAEITAFESGTQPVAWLVAGLIFAAAAWCGDVHRFTDQLIGFDRD